ncbi:predicted protein [Chaetomium globosum CBS 148.51]|uniref:Uncharacterized protein n=1 Tax=Chaetomium globosum (strain ATCC 6205 / CBS 148.51 / DSM 1962 / NBRC 6347 / NRRL 1970) TaxID=306901 RepID=Q2HAP0_CHAGB|nr:uncharacterized protein CHGG_02714 [Chaetomium globosum CBS 148.51]EAQ90779.1 predicted protein [Chaetomium globosum CBS 148.51]
MGNPFAGMPQHRRDGGRRGRIRHGEVLRSEVVAAITLLKLQFRFHHFCRHHTLPGRPESRTSTTTERSLVLRQFRLLDFRSNEPTTDAYHMIRWMANRPMGETRFLDVGDEEPFYTSHHHMDKDDGKLLFILRYALGRTGPSAI